MLQTCPDYGCLVALFESGGLSLQPFGFGSVVLGLRPFKLGLRSLFGSCVSGVRFSSCLDESTLHPQCTIPNAHVRPSKRCFNATTQRPDLYHGSAQERLLP